MPRLLLFSTTVSPFFFYCCCIGKLLLLKLLLYHWFALLLLLLLLLLLIPPLLLLLLLLQLLLPRLLQLLPQMLQLSVLLQLVTDDCSKRFVTSDATICWLPSLLLLLLQSPSRNFRRWDIKILSATEQTPAWPNWLAILFHSRLATVFFAGSAIEDL